MPPRLTLSPLARSFRPARDPHLGTNLFRSNRYAWRVRGESFLLGSVRDPASRAVSRVFWTRVTQQEREPTDANVVKWLSTVIPKSWIHPRVTNEQYGTLSEGQGGFQINYLNQQRIEPWTFFDRNRDTMVKHPRQVEAMVADVLAQVRPSLPSLLSLTSPFLPLRLLTSLAIGAVRFPCCDRKNGRIGGGARAALGNKESGGSADGQRSQEGRKLSLLFVETRQGLLHQNCQAFQVGGVVSAIAPFRLPPTHRSLSPRFSLRSSQDA